MYLLIPPGYFAPGYFPSSASAPAIAAFVTEITGSQSQDTFYAGEKRPLIFTFAPADGAAELTLVGTPAFDLQKCYAPGQGVILAATGVSTNTATARPPCRRPMTWTRRGF